METETSHTGDFELIEIFAVSQRTDSSLLTHITTNDDNDLMFFAPNKWKPHSQIS
jgi:hypothetical protein